MVELYLSSWSRIFAFVEKLLNGPVNNPQISQTVFLGTISLVDNNSKENKDLHEIPLVIREMSVFNLSETNISFIQQNMLQVFIKLHRKRRGKITLERREK